MSLNSSISKKNLPSCKSLHKFLVPMNCIYVSDINNSLHHSQYKLEVITNSNFVIKRHKPISNPWNECSYIHQEKPTNLIIYRQKLKSMNPIKQKVKRNQSYSRISTKIKCNVLKDPKPAKDRRDSLCGWS